MNKPETFRAGEMLRRLCATIILASTVSACMTTRVEETKDMATGIGDEESIVILATSYHTGNETEDKFLNCVSNRVKQGAGSVNLYPESEFRDALFPWFEPRTAPQGIEDLPGLISRPGIANRIRERKIRYIVWVNGDTDQTGGGGSLSCAIGPGGGGCFGLAWWENESAYQAAVWDLENSTHAGAINANVTGTSVIPAIVIPVPVIARTQALACKSLANQLKFFIVNEGPST